MPLAAGLPVGAGVRVAGPQGVDHPAAGQLDGLVHVDAQMLDRLERADRLTELRSGFGVADGEVHDCARDAERVGGGRDQHVVDHRGDLVRRHRGQAPGGGGVERDAKLLAGRVDAGLGRN